jgi:hypothetical protein
MAFVVLIIQENRVVAKLYIILIFETVDRKIQKQ